MAKERSVTNKDLMEVAQAAYIEARTARGMTQAIYGEILVQLGVPRDMVKEKLAKSLEQAQAKAEADLDALLGAAGLSSRKQQPEQSPERHEEPRPAGASEKAAGVSETPQFAVDRSAPEATEQSAQAEAVPVSAPADEPEEVINIGPLSLRRFATL